MGHGQDRSGSRLDPGDAKHSKTAIFRVEINHKSMTTKSFDMLVLYFKRPYHMNDFDRKLTLNNRARFKLAGIKPVFCLALKTSFSLKI